MDNSLVPGHRTFTRNRLLSGERFVPLHIGMSDPLKLAEVPQDIQDISMMVFFTRVTYVLGNIEKRIAKKTFVGSRAASRFPSPKQRWSYSPSYLCNNPH